jgi:ubiquitin conjugation factor E4 A
MLHLYRVPFHSIEETGQAVQFEQKFSYRRPMYDVIKYIWTLEDFREKFAQMAIQAEREIESEVRTEKVP